MDWFEVKLTDVLPRVNMTYTCEMRQLRYSKFYIELKKYLERYIYTLFIIRLASLFLGHGENNILNKINAPKK